MSSLCQWTTACLTVLSQPALHPSLPQQLLRVVSSEREAAVEHIWKWGFHLYIIQYAKSFLLPASNDWTNPGQVHQINGAGLNRSIHYHCGTAANWIYPRTADLCYSFDFVLALFNGWRLGVILFLKEYAVWVSEFTAQAGVQSTSRAAMATRLAPPHRCLMASAQTDRCMSTHSPTIATRLARWHSLQGNSAFCLITQKSTCWGRRRNWNRGPHDKVTTSENQTLLQQQQHL